MQHNLVCPNHFFCAEKDQIKNELSEQNFLNQFSEAPSISKKKSFQPTSGDFNMKQKFPQVSTLFTPK